MEDPNRMRTKLRLDLNDIARQIEDINRMLENKKTPELIEEHRSLIDYEKKLKEQYEKMTGLSIEQATNLRGAKRTTSSEASGFAKFLGMLGATIFVFAYYNLGLHAIGDFLPTGYINYLTGTVDVQFTNLDLLVGSITYETTLYIVVGSLGAPIVFTLLRSLLSNSRAEIYSVLESLALILPSIYLIFLIALPNAANSIKDNFTNFAIILAVSGLCYITSGMGTNFMGKLFGLIGGGLFFFAAYMAYISTTELDIIYNWAIINFAIMSVGLTNGTSYLLGFIKD